MTLMMILSQQQQGYYKSTYVLGELPNWLGLIGSQYIADAIRTNRSCLCSLSIDRSNIPPEGLTEIANALQQNTVLTDMDVSREKSSREGLAESIKAIESIKTTLMKNRQAILPLVGEAWLESIRRPVHMKGIESVYRTA